MPNHLPLGLLLALATIGPLLGQTPAGEVRYGRDVRPLLADRCFRCHGPDAATREADLRLDERSAALAPREGGAALVPGSPEQSLLWQRVQAHDEDERMPPASSGKRPLQPAELAILDRWIRSGAEYEPHWAFTPPRKADLPDGSAPHPIDRFLAATQRQHGVTPSPPAAPAALARRLFLVLTGLPPTPDELAAFVADDAPDAYERLVDRLLGEEPWRTRHAEHLAQMWLDAGRYADTSGIHMDAGRQAWAWRDWLLQALRDDMPFDQFVLEQLAGDLLPDATPSQKVATGFLRNHVTTDEGGAIDEEYRVEYAAERVATVGSVFLGLTLNCARCHDHKYDPIRQDDYYRLFSFFNSNQEPGLYSQSNDSNRALEPFLPVPTMAQGQRRSELAAKLAAAEQILREPSAEEAAAFAAFRTAFAANSNLAWHRPTIVTAESRNGATLTVSPEGAVVASGKNPAIDVHVVTMLSTAENMRWLALTAEAHRDLPQGRVGRAPNGNAVLQHVRLEVRPLADENEPPAEWQRVRLIHALADVEQQDGDYVATNVLDDDQRGWAVGAHQHDPRPARAVLQAAQPFGFRGGTELRVTLRYDSVYAQHTFGRVAIALGTGREALLARVPVAASGFHVVGPFAEGASDLYATNHGPELVTAIDGAQRWGKLAWRFDAGLRAGSANASLPKGRNVTYVAQRIYSPSPRTLKVALGSDDGFQLFHDGRQVAERRIDRAVDVDQDEATIDLEAGPSTLVLKVVNTGGDGGFALRHVGGANELHGDLRLLLLPDAGGSDAALLARLADSFREHTSPFHKARKAEVVRLKEELAALDASIPRAMVMDEGQERPTYVLTRGEYDKPDLTRPVSRELPAMFGTLPPDAPRNRLGLARWLVGADNPLFLRVQVNRLWEFVFGSGLVRTSEDFGHQGEWPSHVELLDWLAQEFAGRGHSVRSMLRLLVTSAAFRQQSRWRDDNAAVDRDNRWLTWFPRRRLSAEAIRDQALFVGGLLVERAFGPSVKPIQPPGLWQEVAMVQSNTRAYTQGEGDDLWRRSLYTYWKRACPPPSLLTLDAPTREFCTIRRSTTNTPLQALVLWNDEQFLAAARGLAARSMRAAASDEARLRAMFLRCTSQTMGASDLAAALATLRTLQQRYAADPAAAKALASTGHGADANLPATELAPLVMIASAFFALDAALCID